jgi:hypothetical protein
MDPDTLALEVFDGAVGAAAIERKNLVERSARKQRHVMATAFELVPGEQTERYFHAAMSRAGPSDQP